MKPNQMRNLLEFTALFLSGDMKFWLQSTDYYKEKIDKYINIPVKHHDYTDTEDTVVYFAKKLYEEWSRIWGENDDVKSLFLYFSNIVNIYNIKVANKIETFWDTTEKHWLLDINPDELLDTFDKWMGNSDDIKMTRYSNIHPLVKEQIINKYIKKYDRFFKFLRILKEE